MAVQYRHFSLDNRNTSSSILLCMLLRTGAKSACIYAIKMEYPFWGNSKGPTIWLNTTRRSLASRAIRWLLRFQQPLILRRCHFSPQGNSRQGWTFSWWSGQNSDALFQAPLRLDGEALIKVLIFLFRDIWNKQRISLSWGESLITLTLKNEATNKCSNHLGISLLPVDNRVLTSITFHRMTLASGNNFRKH